MGQTMALEASKIVLKETDCFALSQKLWDELEGKLDSGPFKEITIKYEHEDKLFVKMEDGSEVTVILL